MIRWKGFGREKGVLAFKRCLDRDGKIFLKVVGQLKIVLEEKFYEVCM